MTGGEIERCMATFGFVPGMIEDSVGGLQNHSWWQFVPEAHDQSTHVLEVDSFRLGGSQVTRKRFVKDLLPFTVPVFRQIQHKGRSRLIRERSRGRHLT